MNETMTARRKHLTKAQLRVLAARSLNLLMVARSNHEFQGRDENDFHAIVKMLPPATEELYWQNYTIEPNEI